jgi:competence protein ComEA
MILLLLILAADSDLRFIDLNQATVDQLAALPGIGKRTAERIILQRERRAFRRPYDLLRVKGIGPKTYERMRPWVFVRRPPRPPSST